MECNKLTKIDMDLNNLIFYYWYWLGTYQLSGAQYIFNIRLVHGSVQHSSTITGNCNCRRSSTDSCCSLTIKINVHVNISVLEISKPKTNVYCTKVQGYIHYPRKYCLECTHNTIIISYNKRVICSNFPSSLLDLTMVGEF